MTIKLKRPSIAVIPDVLNSRSYIEASEWIALGGPPKGGPPVFTASSSPLNDWKTAVGTGAWFLTNSVDGSSLNFVRNPDYWGRDERHPENKIPYADKVDILCIQDSATAMAALRTKKIDILFMTICAGRSVRHRPWMS